MINSLKNIIMIMLAALLLTVAGYAWYQQRQRVKAEGQTASSQKVVKEAATIINRYIDSSGRKHTVISADSSHLKNDWYKNGTAISGGLVDTVAEALRIAKDKLQEVTQIAAATQADKLKAEKKIDSLQRLTYYYQDKYLKLAYRPPVKGDTTDSGQFDFSYNDSLNVVQYWKRTWLFGAKKSYIDIYSNDPRTIVNGIKRLVIEQKEPSFGLRIQAVGTYNFATGQVNVGPGLQFDFKRLSAVGSYYYDYMLKQFRPTLGARYDLVRF